MQKILIIQTAFIGDVILATSLLDLAKHQFPNAQIDFLLRNGNEGILKDHPSVSKVWVWNKKTQKFLNLIKLAFAIRAQKYDAVLNIQRFFNSGLITALSGSPLRIGFKQNPLSIFFNRIVDHQIPHKTSKGFLHEVQRNALLFKELQKGWQMQSAQNLRPSLYPTKEDFKKVEAYTSQIQLPYLVLAPASVWFTKQWAKEKWIELTKTVSKDYHLFFIGAPSDKELCQEIIGPNLNCTNLCGELNLVQSAALMKSAKRVLANDSAPLHLASAINARITTLFCSTIPEFGYTPISDDCKIVTRNPRLECTPCGLHGKKACPLGHFKCALDIEIQSVIETI